MIFLHEHFGNAFVFSFLGLALILTILAMECGLVLYLLRSDKYNSIFIAVITANSTSFFLTNAIMDKVFWFPWTHRDDLYFIVGNYEKFLPFVKSMALTIFIESIIMCLMLATKFPLKKVLKYTVTVNAITSLAGFATVYWFALALLHL